MGMKIIEQSGNFTPSDYGLITGDVLDLILVGGGQSGSYADPDGDPADGGDSSFGSLSSASGITMGYGEDLSTASDSGLACGAGGYLPGVPFYGGNGGTPVGMAGIHEDQTPASPYCNPRGAGNKGASGNAASGHGYGAGGGAGWSNTVGGKGGNAGKIAFGSVVLSSTSPISVTVGAGGINAAQSTLVGAPGVVIVFW